MTIKTKSWMKTAIVNTAILLAITSSSGDKISQKINDNNNNNNKDINPIENIITYFNNNSGSEFKKVKDLEINKNEKTYTVIDKNEKAGIEDMRKLVEKSLVEEKWIYNKDKQNWNELGIKEGIKISKNGSYVTKIQSNRDLYQAILKNGQSEEYHMYHIHPNKSLFKQGLEILLSDTTNEKYQEFLEISSQHFNKREKKFRYTDSILKVNFEDKIEAKPSIADLTVMINEQRKSYKENPSLKLKHRICSQHGITEYGLLTETKKRYANNKKFRGLLCKNPQIKNYSNGAMIIYDKRMYIAFTPHKNI